MPAFSVNIENVSSQYRCPHQLHSCAAKFSRDTVMLWLAGTGLGFKPFRYGATIQ